MNVRAHIAEQIPGQVSNQARPQYPGLPQENGNRFQAHVQNLCGQGNTSATDPEFAAVRKYVQNKIFEFLTQKKPQVQEVHHRRIFDIVRRLEEGLLRTAASEKEYMNLDTLESRLHVLIRQIPMGNRTPQHSQFVNSPASISATIPTPGMQHKGNANLIIRSSADPSTISAMGCSNISSSTTCSGSLLPRGNELCASVHGSSSHSSEGSLLKGYQQKSQSFSVNYSGNNAISSIVGQAVGNQMIPTPGFGSSNNHTFTSVESASSGVGVSIVNTSLVSQQVRQKQHLDSQNSSVLPNHGSQIDDGTGSSMHQMPYAFKNGSLKGRFVNNAPIMNGTRSSESYFDATSFVSSPISSRQQFDQQQQPFMQGDGCRLSTTGSSASGNLSSPTPSIGSLMDNQNMNQVRMHSIFRSNSLMGNQSNLQSSQLASNPRHQSADQLEKSNCQTLQSARENVSPLCQAQYQQQSSQFQQQLLIHERQQKQRSQQRQTVNSNDAFGRRQSASDFGSPVKCESELDSPDKVLQSQLSGHVQLFELQNKLRKNTADSHPMNSQNSFLPGTQDGCLSLSSSSSHLLQPHQLVQGARNQFDSVPVSQEGDTLTQTQCHCSETKERFLIPGNLSRQHYIQEEFHHRINGHDEAQRNNLSSEGSISQTTAASALCASISGPTPCRSGNANRERQFINQQRWLLFLRHARRCSAPPDKCQDANCITVQMLWKHMDGCKTSQCSYPRCHHSKVLIYHNKRCKDPQCPVCVPVRKYLQVQLKARAWQNTNLGLRSLTSGLHKTSEVGECNTMKISKCVQRVDTTEDTQPSVKRPKTELSAPAIPVSESLFVPAHARNDSILLDVQQQEFQNSDNSIQIKTKSPKLKKEVSGSSVANSVEIKKDSVGAAGLEKSDGDSLVTNEPASSATKDNVKVENDAIQNQSEDAAQSSDVGAGSRPGKPKIKAVSLIELFTPEQVREHIRGLRKWVGQSKTKAEKNQAMEHSMSENSCQLCAVEKLIFEPPPIYCSPCGARIKRNAMYYTVGTGDTRHYFCIPCYNEARGDTVVVDGSRVLKSRLEKKKNDEETEEWWVQCDKCEAWQHQICALFNGRRNDGGQAEYTCPNCYIQEVERGGRKPLPQSSVLGAKDLPRTILSDHIEQRLFRRLRHEREDRAKLQGKTYEEVPGAEEIVVRVVSSVDKKLEVKPQFLEIFQEENYPIEFPYKSKVILLFQKIEGVEVCLFGMYVQEFGSECQPPNQRRVYLSYLDSVKYFRPEVKTVTGEALRTFVYHEILIGYLEYCKKRGFTSCYIWACPPLKGEDYILYCHPEIQKTPKSDKLREWYLSMLRKAKKENIVADLTNLYDYFFVKTGEWKAKVTAARLPYFDGDYWPGAAEDIIFQLNQEEDDGKPNRKGATKKTITKRGLKASGQSDRSNNASKDILLMHKLGETILPMKEDFIMVHLQHACSHCCVLMVSGNRWVCKQCKHFQLCDKCYEAEQKLDERERHPSNQDTHALQRIDISDVPDDTKDKDEILESEFFDTRQAFLSLCQGNHYQYDTLRRAKHSSMMVLYHLHNPTAPAFVTTCNRCHLDIETGQGWRCETCPDYDVCDNCYQKEGGIDHPHRLTNHPSVADCDAQNKEARQLRVLQLRKMLDLLVHASQCRSPHCQYSNCRKVKSLFRHGIQCRTRASGGCLLCKKMWYLLQLHARTCKESECHVPRCRDLKEHLRRLQQQSESRRRAAVMEMMRQRAVEVAGIGG